jgi:hypothetical protein
MNRILIALALVSGPAACSYGMTAEKFRPATDPHGVMATITTAVGELRGEVIELQDAGLVILSSRIGQTDERTLRLVPYAAVRTSKFEQLDSRYSIRDGSAPAGNVRERLRLVSRFPHGMSAAVLAELLKANGQTELAGIER